MAVIMKQRLGPLTLLLLPLLLLGAGAGALSGKRIKVNKYAKFSKAHEVSKSLRFSNIDVDSASGPAAAAAACRVASSTSARSIAAVASIA